MTDKPNPETDLVWALVNAALDEGGAHDTARAKRVTDAAESALRAHIEGLKAAADQSCDRHPENRPRYCGNCLAIKDEEIASLKAALNRCDPLDASHIRYLEHEETIADLKAALGKAEGDLKRASDAYDEVSQGYLARAENAERERDALKADRDGLNEAIVAERRMRSKTASTAEKVKADRDRLARLVFDEAHAPGCSCKMNCLGTRPDLKCLNLRSRILKAGRAAEAAGREEKG